MTSASRWTPGAKRRFFEVIAETGNVSEALRAVGRSRRQAYRLRATDADFAARWDEAVDTAVDALEAEARRRALDGYDEPVFYRGRVCGQVRRYSDRLMELLLRGQRPERYRARADPEAASDPTLIITTGIDRGGDG